MRIARRNGFTLIEVLIAMTLLGVMVVLLFSSLKVAAQSWNAGENKIAEVNKKAVVYQFFKRHLTAIRPLPSLDTEQNFETGSQQVLPELCRPARRARGFRYSSSNSIPPSPQA